MTTASIRKKLITYIAVADDKKVKGLYMLVEDDIRGNPKFSLSASQMKMLDAEKIKHQKGKSKSYSWQESKDIIRGKRKL